MRDKVEALGDVIVWQLHGEITSGWKPMWLELAERHDLEVRNVFHKGKNAADIALTIAAMDLLHGGVARGFCIATGDSDFAPLVRRLKAQHLPVYGFGQDNASAALRRSCTEYFVLQEPLALEHGGGDRKAEQDDLSRLRDLIHSACQEKGTNGRIAATAAGIYLRQNARELVERVLGKKGLVDKLVKLRLIDKHLVDGQILISVPFPRLKMVSANP
jgi:hypothetical protein